MCDCCCHDHCECVYVLSAVVAEISCGIHAIRHFQAAGCEEEGGGWEVGCSVRKRFIELRVVCFIFFKYTTHSIVE